MKTPSWFNMILIVTLLAAWLPATASAAPPAPDAATPPNAVETVGVRLSNMTTLPAGVTPTWAADYGSFMWLELPVSQLPLPRLSDAPYEVVELTLGIHNFRFDPLRGEPAIAPELRSKPMSETGLYLVQFHGPVADVWLQDLRDAGLRPLQYYPHNTYLVWGAFQATEAVNRAPYVRWSGAFQPAYKLNPTLAAMAGKLEDAKVVENVAITFYNDGDIERTLKALSDLGGEYLQHFAAQPDGAFQTAIFKLPAGRLNEAANLATVWAMDYVAPRPGLDDEVSNQISTGNHTGGVPFTGYQSWLTNKGVSGAGVIFADVDSGLDTNNNATAHLDIRGRIAAFVDYTGGAVTTDTDGHGTHTGGIIAGNGAMGRTDPNGFLYGQGVAPGAQLVVQNALQGTAWPPAGGWQQLSKDSVLNHAVGSNNSWYTGASGAQGYSAAARTHDFMVRDANFDTATVAEPLIMVFSAGNSGSGASTITEPKEAKNLISVGASENYRPDNPLGSGCGASANIEGVVSFSSRGPALDGRLLPNIVAPGSDVASLRSYTGSYSGCGAVVSGQPDYVYMSGTSMAAPQVSGGVALITQWWRALKGGANPSPAMAKALLINGATGMTSSSIPNNNQGWGRMNLDNVIESGVFSDYYDQDFIFGQTGETWQATYRVADPTRPVKVTLVWSDAPGAAGANPALVNNLDLVVTAGGNTYLGNVFSGGQSVTGGTADALNNIENVFLPAGTDGIVEITINASNLAGDGVPYNGDATDQDFALVVYNVAPPEGLGWLEGTVTGNGGVPLAGAALQVVGADPTKPRSTTTATDGTYLMALMTDTYTLTVSAYGYLPAEISGVAVISGAVTTQDVALTAAPAHTVSGYVTDANTGWPLYAKLDVSGYPHNPIYNDPVTGYYSVSLPDGSAYVFDVTALIAGYLPSGDTVTLSGSDVVQDFALTANQGTCNAPGYHQSVTPLMTENFDSATRPAIPTGWQVVDVNGATGNWATSASTVHPSGQSPHSSPNLAYFNSYNASSGSSTRLQRTSGLDLSAITTAQMTLWMYHDTGYTPNNDRVQVQISTDGGTTWNDVEAIARYDGSAGWKQHSVNLSAYAGAGMTNVRLGLLGISGYGNDVHIDDVQIAETICHIPTGGLVIGNVTDANNGAPLNGAAVRNAAGDTSTTAAFAGPAGAGFYYLYAPAGDTVITATRTAYAPSIETLTVSAGATARQDFSLDGANPHVAPAALDSTMREGLSVTLQMTVSNNNPNVPFDFELVEGTGGDADVLVVRRDTVAAGAMEAALTTLGYTSQGVTTAAFQAMTVNDLLKYQAVFYTGNPDSNTSGTEHTLLIAYLDNGGKLYISDNDLGYAHRSSDPTGFYGGYLQATYVADNYGDGAITGLDIMTGLNPDTTADLYPDSFTVRAEGVKIFNTPTGNNAAGVKVSRNGYKVIYTSFDFNNIASVDDETELIRRVTEFFDMGDIPWLTETPITGTVPAGGQAVVEVVLDSSAVSASGNYVGALKLTNNGPYGSIIIPVTMTVISENVYTATTSGNWSDASSWEGGATPTGLGHVVIAAGVEITVDVPVTCHNLTVESGARLNLVNPATVYGTLANAGQLHQEALVNGSSAVDFGMLTDGAGNIKYYGVTLGAGFDLGLTSVDIYGSSINGTGNLTQSVGTWFDINPTHHVVTPTVVPVTFWYPAGALNGNDPATAQVYHYLGGGDWEYLPAISRGAEGTWHWLNVSATGFSPFLIKSADKPTAVSAYQIAADGSPAFMIILGLGALGALLLTRKRA